MTYMFASAVLGAACAAAGLLAVIAEAAGLWPRRVPPSVKAELEARRPRERRTRRTFGAVVVFRKR